MNQWFTFSGSILGYAGEFALFALKSAVLRGMPRTEPGTFLRVDYEIKINVAYFCLSPLLLVAAGCFWRGGCLHGINVSYRGLCGCACKYIKACIQRTSTSQSFLPQKNSESHTVIISKLNENSPPLQAQKAVSIPQAEISVDEVTEDSENEYHRHFQLHRNT